MLFRSLVAGGTAKEFSGSLADYSALVLAPVPDADGDDKKPEAAKPNRKDERRAAAAMRERTQSLRQVVKAAEQEIARLAKKRQEIEDALNDPVKTKDGAKRGDLMKSHGAILRDAEAAEAKWMDASLALEEAEATPSD